MILRVAASLIFCLALSFAALMAWLQLSYEPEVDASATSPSEREEIVVALPQESAPEASPGKARCALFNEFLHGLSWNEGIDQLAIECLRGALQRIEG